MPPPDHSRFGSGQITHNTWSSSPRSCMYSVHSLARLFTALRRLCQAILFLILGRSELFISILGFLALGLESTLPIPQLIRSAACDHALERLIDRIAAITNSARSMASVCRHSLAGSAVTLSSACFVVSAA